MDDWKQVYLLAMKVSFHPMAKVFSLCERILVLMTCGFVETFKAIFYYTSCQPNWQMFAPNFILDNVGVTLKTSNRIIIDIHGHSGTLIEEIKKIVALVILLFLLLLLFLLHEAGPRRMETFQFMKDSIKVSLVLNLQV